MTADYRAWAHQVRQLDEALARLKPAAAHLGIPSPAATQWFQLLDHKLLPQLQANPVLVVAVVGGTNIGKSVLFNQLAGELASAVSPLAAGTKHPVCLVPRGSVDAGPLARLFEGFVLKPWRSAEDPLEESEEDRLFFEQIKEKATKTPEVIRLRQANPFDKFQLGLRKVLERLMIQRLNENDKIVTRYMDDKAFEQTAFGILSKVIYDTIPATDTENSEQAETDCNERTKVG